MRYRYRCRGVDIDIDTDVEVDVDAVVIETIRAEGRDPSKGVLFVGFLLISKRPDKHKDFQILFSRPNRRGIPEIMVCTILMSMWSFGPLLNGTSGRSGLT